MPLSGVKSYCVNIDRRFDRWCSFLKESTKIRRLKTERFSAITPVDIREFIKTRQGKLHFQTTEQKNSFMTLVRTPRFANGNCSEQLICELANKCSYYSVLAKALEEGQDSVCVFEDDVYFTLGDGWRESAQKNFDWIRSNFSDWGMFYLGGYVRQPQAKINDSLYRLVGWCTGIHAVIYNKTVMQDFVDHCFDINDATDNLLSKEYYNKYPCFLQNPQIAFQLPDDDSMHRVDKEVLDELDLMTRRELLREKV